ncbi:MAG: phage tail tape measure protein, partial [Mucinivorans sp.]
LLDLASQAGKLGLSAAADVEKFTIAANKIGVALGDDLGDKEAAINSMGKLSDLFKLKDQYGMGDAMLKVGSAVNALGAASTANEGYIVDFTSRTGGIAVSAGVAASSVMALGATFDSLNQPVEASATVVNKLIVGMFSKTSEYAKAAKMEVKDFADLLKTDANEALLRVLEGMDGADLGATAEMLGEVGENGARAAAAVATISKNIGFVREQQELARVEFEKGTSVVDEFNTKNNTAQALREKQKKAAQAALVELGEKLQPIVDMFYAGSIRGMKALKELIGVIYEYKGIIVAVAAALGLYLVAQKLHTNWSRLQAYWSGITSKAIFTETSSLAAASLGTKALAAAKMFLTGQFRAAAVAAKSFWVALGPVGWAVTAITGLVTVMGLLKGSTNEVSGVYSEFGIALRREDNTFKDLKQRLRETAEGTTERADLIKLINELYGTYLPRLLLEKSTTEEIATALDNATVAMKRNIAEKIRASETEKAEQGLYEAKKQAVNTLLESYAESGDRTAGQMALAAQRFSAAIDLIDKTPTTGTERVAAVNTLLSAMGEKLVRSTATIHAAQISLFRRGGPIAQAADALGDYAASYEQYIKSTRTLSALFPNSSEKKKKEQIVVDKACSKCGKTPCECYKSNAESRQAWTLENDTRFAAESIALKRRLLNGEFAQEDDYAKELLALEITTLQSRIAANRDKGADLAKIKEQLLDKQIQQAQAARKREDDLSKIARGGDSELQKAQREHAELLREKG